jgi:ELWxxDGT repeat protein
MGIVILVANAEPTTVGDRLYFVTTEGDDEASQLWRSDGSTAGTRLVRSMPARSLVALGDRLLFWGHDTAHGWEPWVTDGTADGTIRLSTVGDVEDLTAFRDGIVFEGCRSATGCELWRSDGTPAGTRLIKDNATGSEDSGIRDLTAVGDLVFFDVMATPLDETWALWVSDGTTDGTTLVDDVWAIDATAVGDRLVFSADDGEHGPEPWFLTLP